MHRFDETDTLLPDIWACHARCTPDKPALVCDDRSLTWSAFNGAMNRLASALIRSGVKKGDRIAVLASSGIEACLAMFGVVKSGAVVVPMSSMLTGEQVQTLLRDSRACGLLVTQDLRHLAVPVPDGPADLDKSRCIGLDFADDRFAGLDDFCDGVAESEPDVSIDATDPFSIMYSSGTTGLPKGVIHTHSARLYFALSNGFELGFDRNARTLLTTALYTAGTWVMMIPTLVCGGTLHIHTRFQAGPLLAALEQEKITHTMVVPSQIGAILDDPGVDTTDFGTLRAMMSAGSPLRLEMKTDLIARLGHKFYELYGFTEGCSTLLRPEDQLTKPDTVGTAVMGQEILVIDGNDNPLAPGEPGEIVGRGPGLLREYHGRSKETEAAIWHDTRGRSFIRSGDIGTMDEDGFLRIVDRKKDMIISGGLNIYPADIEAVLATHPEIADVSVIGVPDEKWGELPLAVVVPKPGCTPDHDALLSWINGKVAKHQRCTGIELCNSLPRNALGKVLKRDLRETYGART